jgi:tetratricopeptide (TPR) repeat protein
MDSALFLQRLRDLPIEEGRAYLSQHLEELSDYTAIGELMAEEALRVLYTPMLSLKLAELLIYYGEQTGHLSSHALGLKAKGDALERIDHHQASIEALDGAGEIFLGLGDQKNWARSRISWVLSTAWLGKVDEALAVGKQARDMFLQLDEPYWASVINNNLAIILGNMGRNEEAVRLYDQMMNIFATTAGRSDEFIQRSIAIAQVNQANRLFWLGEFARASRLQQDALATFSALKEADLVLLVEVNLAELDYTQGYYGSALRRYYQAREDLEKGGDENALLLADLKIYMANCLIKLDRIDEARLVSEEAVEAYRTVGMTQSIGNVLHQHALTLVASGKLKEALTILEEAWALFKNGGFKPFAYLAQLQQAEILLAMGSTVNAFDQAQVLKQYFDAEGLVAFSVRTRLVMVGVLIEEARASLYAQEKKASDVLEEAYSLCKETTALARQHNLQEEAYKSYYLLGRVFALQRNPARAARHYQVAIAQIERILENLTYDLSPSFLHSTWIVYEDMILLCLEQRLYDRAFSYLERVRSLTLRQHLNNVILPAEREMQREEKTTLEILRTQADLKDWQERYRRYSALLADIDTSISPQIDVGIIEHELNRAEKRVGELFERLHLHQMDEQYKNYQPQSRKRASARERARNTQSIDPEHLRRHLSPDQLLLTYYLHGDRLVIFALNSEGMVTYEDAEGGKAIEYLLPLFHAHLEPGGWADPQHPQQQAIRRLLKKLYTLLIAPVEALLPTEEGCLTIVPFGPLHKLPFHALFDGEHFLIEKFQISYLPASSLLTHIGSVGVGPENRSAHKTRNDQSPLIFGYSENGQLHRVHEEATTIASLLGGQCYLDTDATIVKLIEQAASAPIIHLATHGHSRLDAPNFSYIRLADGQLNAIDAFSLDLAECELVTLSGCETGLTVTSGADEQLGLTRAFLTSGARSLVISLWSVEDAATSELMQCYYRHLLEGASKAQALRAAQCSFIGRSGSLHSHPYFWAAFRLVGDVGPLHYRSF